MAMFILLSIFWKMVPPEIKTEQLVIYSILIPSMKSSMTTVIAIVGVTNLAILNLTSLAIITYLPLAQNKWIRWSQNDPLMQIGDQYSLVSMDHKLVLKVHWGQRIAIADNRSVGANGWSPSEWIGINAHTITLKFWQSDDPLTQYGNFLPMVIFYQWWFFTNGDPGPLLPM